MFRRLQLEAEWTYLVSARLFKLGTSPLWVSLQLARQGVSFRQQSDEKELEA